MDYIQEELLRQQSALAGLLLGRAPARDGTAERPSPAQSAGGGVFPAEEAEGAAAASSAEPPAERARSFAEEFPVLAAGGQSLSAGDGGAFRRESGTGGVWEKAPAGALRRSADTLSTGSVQGRTADAWPDDGRLSQSEAGEAAHPAYPASAPTLRQSAGRAVREYTVTEFQPGASGGVSEPYSGPGWTLPAEIRYTEGRGVPEAEALSRAFQRDARRYDGGFFLY